MMKRVSKHVDSVSSKLAVTAAPVLPVFAKVVPSGLELKILVVPGARSSELVGEHGDRLKVRVQAPPEKGKANEDVCDLISEVTGRKGVVVAAGFTSREKTVIVPGLTEWPVTV